MFALKLQSKFGLLKGGSKQAAKRLQWLLRERCALCELRHPFVIALHAAYDQGRDVGFLLDLAQGGDLFRLLSEGTLDERTARFYVGSIALALQYIHSQDYVYRDLKVST